jgi:hypothetical protein
MMSRRSKQLRKEGVVLDRQLFHMHYNAPGISGLLSSGLKYIRAWLNSSHGVVI